MPEEIKTIRLGLPYRIGSVNCYLIKADAGYILIDTGPSNRQANLMKELESGLYYHTPRETLAALRKVINDNNDSMPKHGNM